MFDHIKKDIHEFEEQIISWRRDFHQYPELSLEEHRTAKIVADLLDEFGLDVATGVGQTGVVGLLEGHCPGRTLLLRADMDALPIQEENDLPYRSRKPGVMHACGHDGHTAILLGLAKFFSRHKQTLPGRIKFVFQPGEEGFNGAEAMIQDGVLKNPDVDVALALHLISVIPTGMVGLRSGPMMASADSFRIRITGQGGHGAMPEGGVDAILMSAHAITALQSLISREVSPSTPLVVHVGTIQGGQAFNIIAENVEMTGTVRTLDAALQKTIPGRMDRILKGMVESFRGTYEFDYQSGCPTVVNDPALTHLVERVAGQVLGQDQVFEIPAIMGSDDMAFFLDKVPGCYFCLGTGNPAKGTDHSHHHNRFNIDEDSLAIGAEVMAHSALTYLTGS